MTLTSTYDLDLQSTQAKVQVNGQSVSKIEWKQTDGTTDGRRQLHYCDIDGQLVDSLIYLFPLVFRRSEFKTLIYSRFLRLAPSEFYDTLRHKRSSWGGEGCLVRAHAYVNALFADAWSRLRPQVMRRPNESKGCRGRSLMSTTVLLFKGELVSSRV